MKRILLLYFMFLTAFVFNALAQRTVSGKITDETGEALPGVNVVIKGTTIGTTTDLDGNYRIEVEDGTTLVISFVGFESQEVEVGARSVIDITMGGVTELQEVVVTGYGPSESKERSNISVATVDSKTIENRPNASLAQRLQGQVAGLNISTGSGQPGANSTIRIRGISSINGDTEPLFIIDGTPVDQDNFRSLNPNDIASVSVLKDAGATAIYGNRGANGVIVIETKGGSYNQELQINYSYLGSLSSLQDNDYDLMNSQEQLFLERDARLGIGGTRLAA
ncbi:MAG: TonB-dependent receptor plug domain-containing protein, partial [Bacteroidota bacterium]